MSTKITSKVSIAIAVILMLASIINFVFVNHSKNQLRLQPSETMATPQTENRVPPQDSFLIKRPRRTVQTEMPPWPKPLVSSPNSTDENKQAHDNIPTDM